jgi:hypothetical protein
MSHHNVRMKMNTSAAVHTTCPNPAHRLSTKSYSTTRTPSVSPRPRSAVFGKTLAPARRLVDPAVLAYLARTLPVDPAAPGKTPSKALVSCSRSLLASPISRSIAIPNPRAPRPTMDISSTTGAAVKDGAQSERVVCAHCSGRVKYAVNAPGISSIDNYQQRQRPLEPDQQRNSQAWPSFHLESPHSARISLSGRLRRRQDGKDTP